MPDLTVPLPAEGYTDLVDDWATANLRTELLRNGLYGVKDEMWRLAEEDLNDRPHEILESLQKCIKKLQWLEAEFAKLVPPSERLSGLRRAANLDEDELAAKLGVKPDTIDSWERGIEKIPQEDRSRVAEFFGASVEWLMGTENDR